MASVQYAPQCSAQLPSRYRHSGCRTTFQRVRRAEPERATIATRAAVKDRLQEFTNAFTNQKQSTGQALELEAMSGKLDGIEKILTSIQETMTSIQESIVSLDTNTLRLVNPNRTNQDIACKAHH